MQRVIKIMLLSTDAAKQLVMNSEEGDNFEGNNV